MCHVVFQSLKVVLHLHSRSEKQWQMHREETGPTSLMVSEALINLEWFSYTRYCMLESSSWISETGKPQQRGNTDITKKKVC